ncbi:MAG: hypothetical protein WC581_14665 [Thermodesulfovibrionales bacterium]
MNNTTKRKAPFSFRLSKEKLKEFQGLSAEAKLQWLEEANSFVNEFVSPEKLRRWEEFKKAGAESTTTPRGGGLKR